MIVRFSVKTLALCVVWVVGTVAALSAEPAMKVHFIDVGQGAATLLEFPCGAMLIDTGAQDQEHVDNLIDYLRDFFTRRKDLKSTLLQVTTTHPHIDHTMGLQRMALLIGTLRFTATAVAALSC